MQLGETTGVIQVRYRHFSRESKSHVHKQGGNSPLPMGRQLFRCPQESRAPPHITVTRDNKHHNSEWPFSLLFLFTFIADWDFMWYGMSFGLALPAVSLPSSLWTPSLLNSGGCEKQKNPCCCKHCLTRLKHPCAISTVCVTNPKQCHISCCGERDLS